MNLKIILGFLVGIAAITATQYFYQPNLALMTISTAILTGLWALVLWSGTRVGNGSAALFKLGLVALAAAFMFIKSLDVVYSLSSAPAGTRFELAPELIAYGAGLWVLTVFMRLFAFGSKK